MGTRPARFVFAVGMALTILAAMTWALAAPSSLYPIYQPQLLLCTKGHRHARACAPILSVGSRAHGHDYTGDRTGGRDLGTVPHRMSFPPPASRSGDPGKVAISCSR
jgi:hypothetical protein